MPAWGEAPATGSAPVTLPRDAARNAAREELLNPVYHRHDPSLLQRLTDWIGQQLDHLFSQVGSVGTGGATGLVLFLVVAATIGAAVWWRLGTPRRAARTTAGLFEADGPRSAEQHRAAAQAHAAAGRWSDAVREQMRALIRALEERALLDPRPGRTADEAATEAGRALPDHAASLAEAARTFDAVAFGNARADQTAYRTLVDLDRTLRAARPRLSTSGSAV